MKPGRKPKPAQDEPAKRIPLSIAAVPDRRLGLLGCYVKFLKPFFRDGKRVASRGETGIVVWDARGVCKEGQTAIRIYGENGYFPVPFVILAFMRGKP